MVGGEYTPRSKQGVEERVEASRATQVRPDGVGQRRPRDRPHVRPVVAVHVPLVVQVAPERGDVRVEQRQPLVDLLLRVRAVLGEHALEQEAQHHEPLLALGRDRREPAVDEVGAEDLRLVGRERSSRASVSASGSPSCGHSPSSAARAPAASRLERRERPAKLPHPVRAGRRTCRAVRALLDEPRRDQDAQVAPDRGHAAGAARIASVSRVAGRATSRATIRSRVASTSARSPPSRSARPRRQSRSAAAAASPGTLRRCSRTAGGSAPTSPSATAW